METIQAHFENRSGATLRGIATVPGDSVETGAWPTVVLLHGFGGSATGYKYLGVHLARRLARSGAACVRFDFHGCGESDGEFEDMTFDGLLADAADIFEWAAAQPWSDERRLFLAGQSMGGYIAASVAPSIDPCGLMLLCPGAAMWRGCAERAHALEEQSGRDYADMEGLVYKMAFNYGMAAHPDPFTEARGYKGPVLVARAIDDKLVSEGDCDLYAACYGDSERLELADGGHNFTTISSRRALGDAMASFVAAHGA